MYKDIEEVYIEFDMHGSKVFTDLYNRFSSAAGQFNRKQNENVFQQLSSQYILTLKERLCTIALSLIEKYRHNTNSSSNLQEKLTAKIDAYISEFSRKCRYD